MINFLSKTIDFIIILAREFWWIIFPLTLFIFLSKLIIEYKKNIKKIEEDPRIFLEFSFPQDSFKQPVTSMKNFFENIKNIKIKDDKILIFEIICFRNQLRFLCITPQSIKDLVEVAIYSQYPDVKINLVSDPLSSLPPNIPNISFDIWGEEYKLKKESIYKINTISQDEISDADSKAIDPVAILAETADRTDYQGAMVVQLIVRPPNSEEKDSYEEQSTAIINKLLGKEVITKKKFLDNFSELLSNMFSGMIKALVGGEEEKEEKKEEKKEPSAEDKTLATTLKEKNNLGVFACNFRIAYIAPKEGFQKFVTEALLMFTKQFSNPNQNSLESIDNQGVEYKPSGNIDKLMVKIFQKNIENNFKNNFYQRIINRKNEKQALILNSEEIASIYHFPFQKVSVQSVVYIKSKQVAPPPNLPIIE